MIKWDNYLLFSWSKSFAFVCFLLRFAVCMTPVNDKTSNYCCITASFCRGRNFEILNFWNFAFCLVCLLLRCLLSFCCYFFVFFPTGWVYSAGFPAVFAGRGGGVVRTRGLSAASAYGSAATEARELSSLRQSGWVIFFLLITILFLLLLIVFGNCFCYDCCYLLLLIFAAVPLFFFFFFFLSLSRIVIVIVIYCCYYCCYK